MDQLGLHAAALAARSDRHVPYEGCLAFSASAVVADHGGAA